VSPGKPVTEDELVTTNKLTFFNFNKKSLFTCLSSIFSFPL